MPHLKYFILDKEQANIINWNSVIENSADSCRWNKSRSKFIAKGLNIPKWYVERPIYSKDDIKEMLRKGDW